MCPTQDKTVDHVLGTDYLLEDWKVEHIDDKTNVTRVYRIGFEAVGK